MLNRPFETSRWRHCPYRSYSAVQTAHCMFGVQNPLTCNKVFVSTLVYHGKTPLLSRVKLWRIPRLQRKLRFQSTDDFIPTQAPIPVHVTHTEPGFGVLGQRTSGNMWKQQTASVKVEGLKAPFSSNSGAQVWKILLGPKSLQPSHVFPLFAAGIYTEFVFVYLFVRLYLLCFLVIKLFIYLFI